MPHTNRPNPLHALPKILRHIVRLRIILNLLYRLLGQPEDVGPLLDGLLVVVRAEGGVDAAVPDLHARARAVVVRVHGADDVAPLLGGGVGLAAGAGVVPLGDAAGGGDEAAGWDAGVEGHGFDDVWVGCGEDVGHHGWKVGWLLGLSEEEKKREGE